MADIKISELGAVLTVGDSDVLPMTASGVTSKVSTSLLKDYVIGTTDISAIGDGTVTGAIDAINTDMPDGLDDLDDVTITTPADGEAPVYDSVSQKFKNTAIVTQDEFGDVIAPIEVSPSAHAYSVGKQLLYNNVLYTVTSPIAVSDALTEGTNITASDTVIEQVEDNTEGIEELNDAWQENGAYNIAPRTLSNTTSQGVTYTVNSENIVTATWSSTPTGNALVAYCNKETLTSHLKAGRTYKLTGCPAGGSWSAGAYKYRVYVYDVTTSTDACSDIGNGATFTPQSGHEYIIWIVIGAGAGASGSLTFKPMITTDLNATYDDYQPYAMTNRQLTEVASPKVLYNQSSILIYRQGDFVIAQFNGAKAKDIGDLNFSSIGAKPKVQVNTYQCRCDSKSTRIEIYASGIVEHVGYYETYGSSFTELKTNNSKEVYGIITYIAE